MISKLKMSSISTALVLAMLLLLTACPGGGGGGTSAPPAATPVATAVGTPIGSAASVTIGAVGGTLSSPDGRVTLNVPAGALAANMLVGIQPITNHAHGGKGVAYRFTPDGQTFQSPVTLKFTYTDADLEGTVAQAMGAAFQTADGYWHWVKNPVLDIALKTVTVSTTHFTDYADAAGFNLRPGAAAVKVGGTVGLHVKFCYPTSVSVVDASGDELAPLLWGLECSDPSAQGELAPLSAVSQWTVSGAGSVSGGPFSATYTAPATKPTPNTAVVSARIDNTKFGTLYLLSHITITDTVDYVGYVNFVGTNTSTVLNDTTSTSYFGQAKIDAVRTRDDSGGTTYTLTGTPGLTGLTFDIWDETFTSPNSTKTCHLISQYSGLPSVMAGTIIVAKPISSYSFGFTLAKKAKQRCVETYSNGLPPVVTVEDVAPDVALTTQNGISDPGFRPLGDGKVLQGNHHFVVDGIDMNITWELKKVGSE